MQISDSEYPRILILNSQDMNKNNATGITLRSVFSCVPKDRLLQVYRYKPWNLASAPLDIESVQIPPKSMPISWLFRRLYGATIEEDKKPSETASKTTVYSRNNVLKAFFKAIIDNSLIIPDKSLLSRIKEFRPDYIYTLGGGLCIQKWALFFAKRYNCKVVIHYMDNWRQTAFKQQHLNLINKLLNIQLDKLEKRMDLGMVISETMAQGYESIYHHKYIPLMNTVEEFCISDITHKSLIIVYAGGLHLNRYTTLLDIEKAISLFPDTRLQIYTSIENIKQYESLFDRSITTFNKALDHDSINKIFEEADILLHIESFNSDDIEYTKYSLSTKIPEYMMAGKPIICYAPSCLASYQYVQNSKAGICVETHEELIDAIKILHNKEKRKDYGIQGIETAKKNHSIESTVMTLHKVFKDGDESNESYLLCKKANKRK